MTLSLVYTAAAEADLVGLFNYVAVHTDPAFAAEFVTRLTAVCDELAHSPERGTRRDDIRPGVRSYGWRRRATIVFRVAAEQVLIIGIFYGGRDIDAALAGRDFEA